MVCEDDSKFFNIVFAAVMNYIGCTSIHFECASDAYPRNGPG